MQKVTIWFVLGPIGAGKSSYINKVLQTNDLVFLSPDLIKKEKNTSYLETRELMENLIKQHIENKISFIIEGTGQHDDVYDLFTSYKNDPTVNLKVTYIDIDLETALERNKSRERVLPDNIVRDVYKKCKKRRHLWKEFNCEYIDHKDLFVKDQNFSNIY